MNQTKMRTEQGHWLLAKMGKRVLRPGGRELTQKLLEALAIDETDDVVEFAPGLGHTASMVLGRAPRSYTGVELNEEAAELLERTLSSENLRIVRGNASNSSLTENSVNKVYGEAMLTMQTDSQKSSIIAEAYRILKKGGLYGIHELGLSPDGLSEELKTGIRKDLAKSIRVNARPLTRAEWSQLLEAEGFEVVRIEEAPMRLLEFGRVVEDEGVRRTAKILHNLLVYPKERQRILSMRRCFQRHEEYLNALALIARKP